MSQQNLNNNSNTSKFKSGKVLIFIIKAGTIIAITYGLIVGSLAAFKIAKDNTTPTIIKLKGNSGKDVKSFELDFSI